MVRLRNARRAFKLVKSRDKGSHRSYRIAYELRQRRIDPVFAFPLSDVFYFRIWSLPETIRYDTMVITFLLFYFYPSCHIRWQIRVTVNVFLCLRINGASLIFHCWMKRYSVLNIGEDQLSLFYSRRELSRLR